MPLPGAWLGWKHTSGVLGLTVDVPACQEKCENCFSLVEQEGAQLSNYSTISSNSRLIVNCSSVPATSTE